MSGSVDPVAAAQAAIARGQRGTQAWLRLATALHATRRWDEVDGAIEAARHAARQSQDFAALGELLGQLERYEAACAAYDQALSIDADNSRYLFNRAAVRRFVGRIDDAESDYDRVIALDPADVEAWCNRSELRRQTPARNHIENLLQRLRAGFAAAIVEGCNVRMPSTSPTHDAYIRARERASPIPFDDGSSAACSGRVFHISL